MRAGTMRPRRERRRRWRTAAAIAFGGAAAVLAVWTGAYWAAVFDPIDATAGQLLAASAATATLSVAFACCAWIVARPSRPVALAAAALLVAASTASFLLNML